MELMTNNDIQQLKKRNLIVHDLNRQKGFNHVDVLWIKLKNFDILQEGFIQHSNLPT